MNERPKPPVRGERRQLIDGRWVTIMDKIGGAYRILNETGKIEIAYPKQIMDPQNQ